MTTFISYILRELDKAIRQELEEYVGTTLELITKAARQLRSLSCKGAIASSQHAQRNSAANLDAMCNLSLEDTPKSRYLGKKEVNRGPLTKNPSDTTQNQDAIPKKNTYESDVTNEIEHAALSTCDVTIDTGDVTIGSVVCYGIGRVAESVIAGYQMALVRALRDRLQVAREQCFVYDPVLGENEKAALSELGFTPIQHNEECKRLVPQRTLVFMPHCGKAMYNNLLWRNWHPEYLPNLLILGNSFSSILENTPSRVLETEAAYIRRIAPFTEEYPLSNTFTHSDIFNNTSLHVFPRVAMATAPPQLWQPCDEPRYEHNCEIVAAST